MSNINLLQILQIIIAVFLIGSVSIQTKGTGLGRTFGQSANLNFQRRGLERLIFRFTFVTAFIFILVSLIPLFI